MTDPKVFLLDFGTLVIDESDIHWHNSPGTPVRFPVYGVLVEHSGARILYDTGYDLTHMRTVLPSQLPEQTEQQTVPGQLAVLGLEPDDIDIVVNSHFHVDHVGGNRHLTKATHLAHRDEFGHALSPHPFEEFGYSDAAFRTPRERRREVTGDHRIVPGVELISTPGHSAGHYSLLVEMEQERSMLFCGDAAYTRLSLEQEWIGGFHLDPVQALASIRRLKEVARERDADLYPSHDAAAFGAWKRAPDSYGGR